MLNDEGCDINCQNNNGCTALMLAHYHQLEINPCDYEITKLLINAGCDLNLRDNNGDTALMKCCNGGENSNILAKILIDAGSYYDIKDHTSTCLYFENVETCIMLTKYLQKQAIEEFVNKNNLVEYQQRY